MSGLIKSSSVAPGAVQWFAVNTAPPGWLACNGAAVSRTAYARLFAAVATIYGAGDGSTTFNLPDMRGEFIRGHDNGRGVDSGRVFGAAQADEYRSHQHAQSFGYASGTWGVQFNATAQSVYSLASSTNNQPLVEPKGGTETRPRNVAMLACIKF